MNTRITKKPRSLYLKSFLAILAALSGLALEGAAAWLLSLGGQNASQVLLMILWHVLGCLFLALAFRLRGRGKSSPSFLAFVFCFCFVLPVLGMAGLLLAIGPALYRLAIPAKPDFRILASERRHARSPLFSARFDLGGFHARLLRGNLSATHRLPLLMALGRRSSPAGNRLLRELLRDANDEIRLAAYAILDRREREMQAAIAVSETEVQKATDDSARAKAWHRLAALHWEATYQELAEGEISRRHLEKARHAIESALALHTKDASLLLMQGRVLARLGSISAAREAYAKLKALGLSDRRVRPYQAEMAFHARDFASVRAHLTALDKKDENFALNKVRQFWLDKVA